MNAQHDCYTQAELDLALGKGGRIINLRGSGCFVVKGTAEVRAFDNAKVLAFDTAKVWVYGNAKVLAFDTAKVIYDE